VLRQFWVRPEREAEFERIFGPAGDWAELLRMAKGCCGSELQVESRVGRRYRVRDIWQSHLDFESFLAVAAADLRGFAERITSNGIVAREVVLGSFYEYELGTGEDEDLVPA